MEENSTIFLHYHKLITLKQYIFFLPHVENSNSKLRRHGYTRSDNRGKVLRGTHLGPWLRTLQIHLVLVYVVVLGHHWICERTTQKHKKIKESGKRSLDLHRYEI